MSEFLSRGDVICGDASWAIACISKHGTLDIHQNRKYDGSIEYEGPKLAIGFRAAGNLGLMDLLTQRKHASEINVTSKHFIVMDANLESCEISALECDEVGEPIIGGLKIAFHQPRFAKPDTEVERVHIVGHRKPTFGSFEPA